MRDSIKIEPGCLDDVPISDMARFLAGHSLEMVATADGLKIRKARQPLDFPQHAPEPEYREGA